MGEWILTLMYTAMILVCCAIIGALYGNDTDK